MAKLKENTNDYPKHEKLSIGVVIVNMNNLGYTKDLLSDVLNQVVPPDDIVLVDQHSSEEGTAQFLAECSKDGRIEVMALNKVMPLNKLWNVFAGSCNCDILCFLNNDMRISRFFIADTTEVFRREESVHIVIHRTNTQLQELSSLQYTILEKPYVQGWDFSMRKSAYIPIPSMLKVFGGDDYLFSIDAHNKGQVAMVISSPVIHYKEKTREKIPDIKKIQLSDVKTLKEILAKKKVKVLPNNTNKEGYSKRYHDGEPMVVNTNVVYTSIIGSYDNLPKVVSPMKGWDYICFSDNDDIVSDDVWRIVHITSDADTAHKRSMLARRMKLMWMESLSSYQKLLWIDARINIKADTSPLVDLLEGNTDVVLQKHPFCETYQDEAKHIVEVSLVSQEDIDKIISSQKKYKHYDAAIETSIMLFANNLKTSTAFKMWYDEMASFDVPRDQLFCRYIMWKQKINLKVVPNILNDTKYFVRRPRKTQRLIHNPKLDQSTLVKPNEVIPEPTRIQIKDLLKEAPVKEIPGKKAVIMTTLWHSARELEVTLRHTPDWGLRVFVMSDDDSDFEAYKTLIPEAFEKGHVVYTSNSPYGRKFNTGLAFARTVAKQHGLDTIVVLDSDDIILPGYWDAMKYRLTENRTVSLYTIDLINMANLKQCGSCEIPKASWLSGRMIHVNTPYECNPNLTKGIGNSLVDIGNKNKISNFLVHRFPLLVALKWPDSLQTWNITTRPPKIYIPHSPQATKTLLDGLGIS